MGEQPPLLANCCLLVLLQSVHFLAATISDFWLVFRFEHKIGVGRLPTAGVLGGRLVSRSLPFASRSNGLEIALSSKFLD